jgi:hypothetical protein
MTKSNPTQSETRIYKAYIANNRVVIALPLNTLGAEKGEIVELFFTKTTIYVKKSKDTDRKKQRHSEVLRCKKYKVNSVPRRAKGTPYVNVPLDSYVKGGTHVEVYFSKSFIKIKPLIPGKV